MKNISTLALAALISIYSSFGQSVIFDNNYGGGLDEVAFSSITSDGNHVLFGWTKSSGNGNADFNMIKIDAAGNELSSVTFGGFNSDSGLSIDTTINGGFVLGGSTLSQGAGLADLWIVLVDENGNYKNDFTFGGSNYDYLREVKVRQNGNILFCGYSNSFSNGGKDLYAGEIDTLGNVIWSDNFGGSSDEEGWSVDETSDGGCILGGWTQSYGAGQTDFYAIKLNSLGNFEWSKTFGGTNSDSGLSIKQTSDGGYIFVGSTQSYGAGLADIWMIKMDALGDLDWDETYGTSNYDYGRAVCLTSFGYAISGYSQGSTKDVKVIVTDFNGGVIHDLNYSNTNSDDEGWGISCENDTLLVSGSSSLGTNGNSDMKLIKIKITNPSLSILEFSNDKVSCYPNPTTDIINLDLSNLPHIISISVYNIEGKQMLNLSNVNSLNPQINATNFSKGIYTIVILSKSTKSTINFVKN